MTRSENISTSNCKKHGPKVNSELDPSSSDLSDSSSSSDLAPKRKKVKRRKSVASIRKMTRQTHLRVMTLTYLIHLRTVIIDVDKKKKHRKEDPIRLCATLTAKLLMTAFKSKIIRFRMDEDPLQRLIYFLTFIDSLDKFFLNI